MKGLLKKDLCLLAGQKTTVMIVLMLGIILTISEGDISFAIFYSAFVGATLAISTLSYDSYENGMAFLMTLPMQRKNYVQEKYLFVFLVSTVLSTIIFALGVIMQIISGRQDALMATVIMFVGALLSILVLMSIMIPVQLKFGAEKSRVIMLIVAGIIVVGGFFSTYLIQNFGEEIQGVLNYISRIQITGIQFLVISIVIMVLIVVGSMLIAVKVLEKKEY